MVDTEYEAGVGFVCFKDTATAKIAASTLVHEAITSKKSCIDQYWAVEPAPHPKTVDWSALRVNHVPRWIRSLIVNIVTFLLIFFWMIPVTFAASLANLQTLSTVLPFLTPLLDAAPAAKGFIEGFLPGCSALACFPWFFFLP